MFRPRIVPASLLTALFAVLLAPIEAAPPAKPAPPKPPNLKALYDKLRRIQGDLQRAHANKAKELGKVQSDYMTQRSKLAPQLLKLFHDRQKLREERWKELHKAIDTKLAAEIRAKYATQIEEQRKKVAAKDAEIVKLIEKRDAELLKFETDWAKVMAELATPERKLAELQAQERVDLYNAYGAAAKAVRGTFDPQVANLSKQIQGMQTGITQANATWQTDEAAVWAEFETLKAQLNPPDDRLELRRAILVEERNELMALTAAKADKDVIYAEYKIVIDAMTAQIDWLKIEMELLRSTARQKVAAIAVSYSNAISQLDTSEDSMGAQIASLRSQEWAQLHNLGNSPQANAVRAKYAALMAPLWKKIANKENDIARHILKKEHGRARIIKNYDVQIARLNSRENNVENKLFSLQAKEQAELHKAIDPEKAAAINAEFAARFAEVDKRIGEKQHELAVLAGMHQENMKRISAKYDTQIAKLSAEAAATSLKIQRGGK